MEFSTQFFAGMNYNMKNLHIYSMLYITLILESIVICCEISVIIVTE